jgi:hypothetical protein
MVNEDIITSLRNSIQRGESLEKAKKTLINSGYNPNDVDKAAIYIIKGSIDIQKTEPDEEFVMPNKKKSFFSRNKKNNKQELKKGKLKDKSSRENKPRPLEVEIFEEGKDAPTSFFKSDIKNKEVQVSNLGDKKQLEINKTTAESRNTSIGKEIKQIQPVIQPVTVKEDTISQDATDELEKQLLMLKQQKTEDKKKPMFPLAPAKKQPEPLAEQLKEMKVKKEIYLKEIILTVCLLLLLGVLVGIVIFRDKLLSLINY